MVQALDPRRSSHVPPCVQLRALTERVESMPDAEQLLGDWTRVRQTAAEAIEMSGRALDHVTTIELRLSRAERSNHSNGAVVYSSAFAESDEPTETRRMRDPRWQADFDAKVQAEADVMLERASRMVFEQRLRFWKIVGAAVIALLPVAAMLGKLLIH